MGECCRKTCPCLKTIWDKIYGPPQAEGENSVKVDGDFTNKGFDKNETERRYSKPKIKPPLPPSANNAAIYMALWDFKARNDQELSFKAGDKFEITDRSGDWWTANKKDIFGRVTTGFVPYNYLARDSVESQPWFFGKMNRVGAVSHLMSDENNYGSFLVRVSESDDMGYVLSVRTKENAKHFKIFQTGDQFYVDALFKFSSIVEVIQHYQSHPLSIGDLLREPCIRIKPENVPPPSTDEWELPKEEFQLENQLGSGHFADVYSGKWKNHSKVAIKILKNNDALVLRDFQLEVQIMKRLRHKHLISLFAVCTSSSPFYIITELIEKGDLLHFLRNPEGRSLQMESLVDMAAQVADGMAYLEANNSIHRDLAARNVLVGDGYVCKIADFGLARIIKEPVYLSDDKKIPYKWTAPEAIGHGTYSSKSDVWSFGILLYEIVTHGGIPYPGVNTGEVYDLITKENYRMPSPPKCPQAIYNIMRACWRTEPVDRPNFKVLKDELDNYQGQYCSVGN